jgi:hypothetical protein
MASHSFADDPRTLLSRSNPPKGRYRKLFWGCITAVLAATLLALAIAFGRVF